MLRGKAPLGFTIIETLIFLAVSGFIFISAAALLNGRESQTQFESGVKEIFASLQSISSNVKNGFYSDITHVPCTGSNRPGTAPSFTGSTTQGTNLGCIFVGNAIEFSPNINGTEQDNDYIVYTIAGNQYIDTSDDLSTTLTDATPTLLTTNYSNPTEDAQVVPMPDGITVSYSTAAPLNPGVYYESNSSSPSTLQRLASLLTSLMLQALLLIVLNLAPWESVCYRYLPLPTMVTIQLVQTTRRQQSRVPLII